MEKTKPKNAAAAPVQMCIRDSNQVQQITQLSDQLQQLQQYNKAFGDPAAGVLRPRTVDRL